MKYTWRYTHNACPETLLLFTIPEQHQECHHQDHHQLSPCPDIFDCTSALYFQNFGVSFPCQTWLLPLLHVKYKITIKFVKFNTLPISFLTLSWGSASLDDLDFADLIKRCPRISSSVNKVSIRFSAYFSGLPPVITWTSIPPSLNNLNLIFCYS